MKTNQQNLIGKANHKSRLLTAALFVSNTGSAATFLGFLSYVYAKTGSAFDTGGVTLATLLAGVFLGPFLGVIIKNRGIFLCMVLPEIVSSLLLILIVYFDHILLVYITAFLLSINGKFVGISRMSIIPAITRENELIRFNAMLRATNRAALILGSLAYGVMIHYSLYYIFYFDAATYAVSAALLMMLHLRHEIPQVRSDDQLRHPVRKIISQLSEGYKILFLTPRINNIVYLGILSRFFYMSLPILMLIFIKNDLLLSDREYGYLQTISRSVSFLVFVFLSGLLQKGWQYSQRIIHLSFFLYGIGIYVISMLQDIRMIYIIFSLAELSFFIAVVFVHAYVQRTIPPEKMPLASGSVGTGFSLSSVASLLVLLPFEQSMGTGSLIGMIGIGLCLTALLFHAFQHLMNL